MMNEIDKDWESAELMPLIEAIEKLLSQQGMKATQDQLVNASQSSAHSVIGSAGMVNVIPSAPNGTPMCCKLAVAIAHGTRGFGGLCQVLQQVRSHLICCADARKGYSTKAVVIIYDKEDSRVFWENKRDFLTHKQRNGVNFVCFFWDGSRLVERAFI